MAHRKSPLPRLRQNQHSHEHRRDAVTRALPGCRTAGPRGFGIHTSKAAQTEEEKCAIELTAYLCWLCNVSGTEHWKKTREMAEGVERWRKGVEAWGRRTSLMSEGRANGVMSEGVERMFGGAVMRRKG
jgi:hypothetical protein